MKTKKIAMILAAAASAFAAEAAWIDVGANTTLGEGTVSPNGGKEYKAGAKVNLKATAKKGSGFMSWQKDGNIVSYYPSHAYTVEGADASFTANFISAANDSLVISDTSADGIYAISTGVTPDLTFTFFSFSTPTITVSGLPSGVKYVKGTGTDQSGHFEGAPTKAGVYYVTFDAKNANGYAQTLTQKWIVGGADPADGDFDDIGVDNLGTLYVGKSLSPAWPYFTDEVKKFTASGLPPGLKLTSYIYGDTLDNCIYGYPTKPGKYTINFSKTFVDKAVDKARKTVIVKDLGSYYVSVDVGDASKDLGTVTGSGVYRVGGKIPLSAKPASGNVFAGWFTDRACTKPLVSNDNRTELLGDYFTASGDYRKASDSMTFYYEAISKARNIYAKFVPKDSDWISLSTSLGSDNTWDSGSMNAHATTFITYSVDSGTIPTVSAKGLPSGFKLNAKKSWIEVDFSKVKPGAVYENVQLIAKNQTGKTDTKTFSVRIGNYKSYIAPDVKTDADAYTAMVGEDMDASKWRDDLRIDGDDKDWKMSVSGLPPGVKANYDGLVVRMSGALSKAGVYTPVFIFTCGSGASKRTEKFSFTINVYEQSPALIGTFNGVTCWDDTTYTVIGPGSRLVTITSAKGGKVTAKVGNISFSGNGWLHNGDNKWLFRAESGMVQEGNEKISYFIRVNASSQLKSLGELDMTGDLMRMEKSENGAVVGVEYGGNKFFAKQNCYGKGYWIDGKIAELAAMKALYFDDVTLNLEWEKLTLVTDKKAPIKVTVDKNGVLKLSGKVDGVSVSGSTTLLPETDGSLTGWLPIVEKHSGWEADHIFRFTYKNGVPSLELIWLDPKG